MCAKDKIKDLHIATPTSIKDSLTKDDLQPFNMSSTPWLVLSNISHSLDQISLMQLTKCAKVSNNQTKFQGREMNSTLLINC